MSRPTHDFRSERCPQGAHRRAGAICSWAIVLGGAAGFGLLAPGVAARPDFARLQWAGNDHCDEWVSGFADDIEPRRTHAVVHLTPKGAGAPVITARCPAGQCFELPLVLLCTTTGFAGGSVSFRAELRADGQTPYLSDSLQASDKQWSRYTLEPPSPPGGGPAGYTELALTVTSQGNATLCLCLAGSSGVPTEALLRGLADLYQIKGKPDLAEGAWHQLETQAASPAESLAIRYSHLAATEPPAGHVSGYERLWREAQTELPLSGEFGKPAGYRMARAMVDLLPGLSRRLGEATADPEQPSATAELLAAADGSPLGATGVRACLTLAEGCLGRGDYESALSFALRGLLRDPDAGAPHEAAAPPIEAYLQAANYLPSPEVLRRGLSVALAACAGRQGKSAAADAARVERLSTQWLASEQAADAWDLQGLSGLIRTNRPADAADALSCLHTATLLLRRGLFPQAIEAASLCVAAGEPVALLRLYARYVRGAARVSQGCYASASDDLAAASHASDRWLAATAALELAETCEFSDHTASAREHYQRLLGGPRTWWWARLRAAAGERRVDQRPHQRPSTRSEGPAVVYLGEDRQTRGDWFRHFGGEAFILCAASSPQDVAGGPLADGLAIEKHTGCEDPARSWLKRRLPSHPSFLYDPLEDTHDPANWGDHGEVYPIGVGPDLCVACSVPEGLHRLSLYFTNDCSYYEPSRDLTVEVLDSEGRLRAGTQVRDFLHGVYKQFGMLGPTRLTMRIRRNASMNVTLSGVFLDALRPLPATDVPGASVTRLERMAEADPRRYLAFLASLPIPGDQPAGPRAPAVQVACDALQVLHALHRAPDRERQAFLALTQALAEQSGRDAALAFLRDCVATQRDRTRGCLAIWAAEALADWPVPREELEGLAIAFLQTVKGRSWGERDVPVHLPVARELLARVLAGFAKGSDVVDYCHSFAARHAWKHKPLVRMALRHIVAHAGPDALSNDELSQFPGEPGKEAEKIAFLERRIARDEPVSADLRLWSSLHSLYSHERQYEKILDLARRLAARTGDDDDRAYQLLFYASGLEASQRKEDALKVIDMLVRALPDTQAAMEARALRQRIKRPPTD